MRASNQQKKIADLQNLRAAANDDIEQIVIFYKNGQFKIYKQSV